MKTRYLLPAITLLVGCQSAGHYHDGADLRVDDAWVKNVPSNERGDIEKAHQESLKLKEAVTAAEHAVDVEEDRLGLARDEASVIDEEIGNARKSLDLARRDARNDEAEDADERLVHALRRCRAARAKVEWHQAKVDQLQAEVTTAELRLKLADAKVELAEARAVHDLDRPESRDLSVEEFEASVADHETRVKLAEVDAEAWKKKLEVREKRMKAAEDDAD